MKAIALLLAAASAVKFEQLPQDPVTLTMTNGMMQLVHPVDAFTNMPWVPRAIYDEDGDGVEDNVEMTHDELDRFYIPDYFNTADEIYNTHHGNLPGHRQKIMYQEGPPEVEPYDSGDYEARTVARLSRL